jgi:hypothetical protein
MPRMQPLVDFLTGMEIPGYEDRVIRVRQGRGRQQPIEHLRDEDWERTMQRDTLHGDMPAYWNANEAVTISLYDSLSVADGHYDMARFPYSSMYPDGRFVDEPVYDCLQVQDSDEGSLAWEFPAEQYIKWGVEFAERVITFLVPMHAVLMEREFDWGSAFDDSLALCIDPNFRERQAEVREQRNRERFVTILRQRDDTELRNLRQRIDNNMSELTDAQTQEERARQELRDAQELLDSVLARRDDNRSDDDLLTEYEAVLRHAHVDGIAWHGNDTLSVRTNDITLEHPDTGESTIVGRFRIEFKFGAQDITVHNLTNRRGIHDHPHVRNGSFCQGELKPTLMRLMAQRQVGAAINMTIAALEYCDPQDDWGRHIEWWFGAEDAPEPEADEDA